MINIFFVIIYFSVLLVWFFLLKKSRLSLLNITIPSFVLFWIFIYQYIGLLFIYFNIDEYRAESLSDNYYVWLIWCCTSITITLMLLGCLIGNISLGKITYFRENNGHTQVLKFYQILMLNFIGLICILVLVDFIGQVGLENTALYISMNSGTHEEITLSRSLMGNNFSGNYHWYQLLMQDLLQFVFLSLLSQQLIRSNKITTLSLLFFGAALVISLLLATEKLPIIDFVISIIIIITLTKYQGNISIKLVIKSIILILLLLIALYIFFMKSKDFESSFLTVLSRVFTGSIEPAYYYLIYFPSYHNWLYGSSFPNPGGIFPFVPYELTIEIMNFINPLGAIKGVVGSAPTVYWGEMYANFGFFGVIIAPFFVGYLLYFGNKILFNATANPIILSFFVWLLMHYKNLAITSLSGFLIDTRLVFFITIISIFNLDKFFKRSV